MVILASGAPLTKPLLAAAGTERAMLAPFLSLGQQIHDELAKEGDQRAQAQRRAGRGPTPNRLIKGCAQ